jgi:hypothetical protein
MVTIVKSEWHQVEKRYSMEVNEDTVREIYPDMDDEEITALMEEIIAGDHDFQQLIEDSNDEKVYLDWDWMDEDDWWTDRKGGYDVTYEVQDE